MTSPGVRPAQRAPGPQGADMLRGIRQMRAEPIDFLVTQWQRYGDVVAFPIPRPPVFLISDPADVRQVLVYQHRSTSKRTLQYDNLAVLTGNGLLTADGRTWRDHRRVIQPSFHRDQLAGVREAAVVAADQLCAQWRRLPTGAVVDVEDAMMRAALQVIAVSLFGSDWQQRASDLARATVSALDCVVRRARNPLALPLAAPTPGNVTLRRARRTLYSAVDALITDTSAVLSPFLEALLSGLRTANGDVDSAAVRDELVTFLIAGHETVASALTWAWASATSPAAQARIAADEVYATAAISETLRLYPPAWVITRRTTDDVALATMRLPAGALIIISPWIVHRQSHAWPEPEAFHPERFLGDKSARLDAYLPFGLGPRMCIGRDFALVESAVIMSALAREFELTLTSETDLRVHASVTARPRNGLPMRIARR